MVKMIILMLMQCILLASGQVLLKLGLERMLPFGWTAEFFKSALVNWQFALCGLCYGTASILWMYITKHYPMSQAYPLVSLSYVFGLVAAMIVFKEVIEPTKWIGICLIVSGCYFIVK